MATYWVKSGQGGTDAGTSWANAAESIAGLMTAQTINGGDIIYVHVTHSVATAGAITWTLPESGATSGVVQVLCVDGGDATGASLVDGTVGALTSGALEHANANNAFTISTKNDAASGLFVHGINFKVGSGGAENSASFLIQEGNGGKVKFSACDFWLNNTSTFTRTYAGGTLNSTHEFENCTFRFASTSQGIGTPGGNVFYSNCRINSSGSVPVTLFKGVGSSGGVARADVTMSSCDWSGITNLISVTDTTCAGKFRGYNCAIGTTEVTGSYNLAGLEIELYACAPADGTNGADCLAVFKGSSVGTVVDDQTVYLTSGGATGQQDDGTATAYSLKMTTTTGNVSKAFPLYTPWMVRNVSSTGDKTLTAKVAHTESAVLTTSEIWMEVEYMGEPGATGTQRLVNSPQSIVECDDDCNLMASSIVRDVSAAGSNRTDTAEAWTGITSEKTHTLTASVNCAEVGYVRWRVGVGKHCTNPVYVNPALGVA